MSDVYKQHDATFKNVSAWAILKGGEVVAKFATKYGRRGASGVTVTAYLHVLGLPMVRFREGPGGGYAMKDAAFRGAAQKINPREGSEYSSEADARTASDMQRYPDGDEHWDGYLRKLGYDVVQVV